MISTNSHNTERFKYNNNTRGPTPTAVTDARMYNIIGNAHFDRNNFSEAIDAYQRGLEIELQKLDPAHPNVVITLQNMGEAYRARGDFGLALQRYHEVLELQQYQFGTLRHPDIAMTLQSIAMVYDRMGQLENALEYIKHTLSLQEEELQKFHLCQQQQSDDGTKTNTLRNWSVALTHAGCILFRMNKISKAMDHFQQAWMIQQRKNKNFIEEGAFTLFNIAQCHQTNGSYSEAIKFYTEALHLEELSKGKHHMDSSPTMFKLGEVYSEIGDFDKALIYFQGSLDIERKQQQQQQSNHSRRCNEESFCNISRILIEIGYLHHFQGNQGPLLDTMRELSELDQFFDPSIRALYESLQPFLGTSVAGRTVAAAAAA